MANHFISSNRKQAYLLPPSIDEWLSKDHLAQFIVDVTEQLDLSSILKHYTGTGGSSAYHPQVMVIMVIVWEVVGKCKINTPSCIYTLFLAESSTS